MTSTLIISPHLDDEVLGCASFLQERNPETLIFYSTSKHAFVESQVLKKENEHLIEFLGCKSKFMSFDNLNKLDSIPLVQLVNEFEKLLFEEKPQTVILTHPSYNQDHRAIYEAILTALRPHDKIPFIKRVLLYEEPETFGTLRKNESFKPTYFRTLDIDFKLKAIQIYESQMRAYRSLEQVKTIAKLRGMQANMEYAEAFEIVRWID